MAVLGVWGARSSVLIGDLGGVVGLVFGSLPSRVAISSTRREDEKSIIGGDGLGQLSLTPESVVNLVLIVGEVRDMPVHIAGVGLPLTTAIESRCELGGDALGVSFNVGSAGFLDIIFKTFEF